MEVCRYPGCGARLPDAKKKFQMCRTCCNITCIECKAMHQGMSCVNYAKSRQGENRTALAPLQATVHQMMPQKEEASLEKSPRGISKQEASHTSLPYNENVLPENTLLNGGCEIYVQCRSTGCSGAAVIAREDPLFHCPICKHFTCVTCDTIHESMSCEEYRQMKDAQPNFRDQVVDKKLPATSFPSLEESDDGADGVIVNCRHGTCNGYGYVTKSDTLAQCFACEHWTCRRCEASHDGMTCGQYQGTEERGYPAVIPFQVREEHFQAPKAEPSEPMNENTIQCINPKCDHMVQLDGAIVQARCQNMCGGDCYICPSCKVFTCITCSKNDNSRGIFSKVKDMLMGTRKSQESTPRNVPSTSRGAVPKRKNEMRSTTNETGALAYRKCMNMLCVKYGVVHAGHCSQLQDSECDKLKANGVLLSNKVQDEVCDLCYRRKFEMTLAECEHRLCRTCIESTVRNAYLPTIMCPVKQSLGRCSGTVSALEIKQSTSKEAYNRYKAMQKWEKMNCPNKRCQAEFCIDTSMKSMQCPLCNFNICMDCRACHPQKTCKEYIEWFVHALDKGQLEDPDEKEKRYREEWNLHERAFVPNMEEFDCIICYATIEPEGGLVLKNCHHKICKECLINTVRNSETAEVHCPCIAEDDKPCTMDILDDEIRAILSPEDYDALLEKGVAEAERKEANSFHCKSLDCRGWCIYDAEVNTFDCPICGMANCLRCEAIHPDVTCEVYQADLKRRAENDQAAKASIKFLEDQLEQGTAMRCPTCKVVVIKRGGCDYMVCASCQTALCWATKGPRWGPKGAGDNSGGCRCMVNNVKCHPTCTTCH